MSYINKPGKNSAWKKHVLNNLAADLITYGKIETSLPIAKNLTKLVAKLITWAKKAEKESQKQHFYRLALRYLVNKKKEGTVNKLFTELGKKYQTRPGGYTRIIKLGLRNGDNSLRVIFSLV